MNTTVERVFDVASDFFDLHDVKTSPTAQPGRGSLRGKMSDFQHPMEFYKIQDALDAEFSKRIFFLVSSHSPNRETRIRLEVERNTEVLIQQRPERQTDNAGFGADLSIWVRPK